MDFNIDINSIKGIEKIDILEKIMINRNNI